MSSGAQHMPDNGQPTLTVQRVAQLGLACAVLCAPVLWDPGAVARVGAHWSAADGPTPYWPAEHWLEWWLWAPLVALSACVLVTAPGLALAAAFGAAQSVGRWLICALGLNLLLVSALAGLLGELAPARARGAEFGLWVALLGAACFALLFARARSGALRAWQAGLGAALAPALLVPFAAVALLGPKFHWESFNGDGVHAFESMRLLLVQPTPFWPEEAGAIRGFPGLTSMLFAFPGAWFLRLLGENEGAARVSVVLYLAGVYGGIAALVEQARDRLRASESWLIWGALAVYLVVMAFSATYDPYSADIALPATQDTLTVACVLGAIAASLRGERAWTALFTALSFCSLPSGLMLLGLWLVAAFVCVRPRPVAGLAATAITLIACLAAARAAPALLDQLGQPRPGGEYESLLARFAYLQLGDVRRALFALTPCGLLPGLALLAWRPFDGASRALALVSLAYFAFFYVQAYVSLHHFVPAMLLPLAAFWRSGPAASADHARSVRALALAGLAVALWLSWPASWRPMVHARRIGARLHARVDGYERSAPPSLAAASALRHLFPSGLAAAVPASSYGGSPYIWNHYAQRAGEAGDASAIDYWLQPDDAAPPHGAERIGAESGFTLLVSDREAWRADAQAALPHPPGAPLYVIDRGRLFLGAEPRSAGPRIYDLRALRRRWDW